MSENSNRKVKEEIPNTEVVAKARRKRFTAAEKLRILREVDACQGSGEIGALGTSEIFTRRSCHS